MKQPLKIPFELLTGNMASYIERWKEGYLHKKDGRKVLYVPTGANPEDYEKVSFYKMADNFVFNDTLEFTGYSRGRSSALFKLKSCTTGLEYTMFVSDMDDLVRSRDIIGGKVSGDFTFCKKGQNYGLKIFNKEKE